MSNLLGDKIVETAPDAADERLRGRTYAIPFARVWDAAHALAAEGLRGWKLIDHDDYEGVMNAEAHSLMWRRAGIVEIRIRLDENAQTRVDLRAGPKPGESDFGASARRIARFCRALDERVKTPATKPAK